ncbi:hypothetical protein CSC73_03990 [Pseudoxanthomonas sacheonensis]|nr:hypothetical protein CSC73_03990 [Pseudoxanthomonas sacheonensis]
MPFPLEPVVKNVVGPERQSIVLLVGGPYDGQDIVVTKEEWTQDSLMRNGHRYASESIAPGVGPNAGGMRIFTWVDPAR